MVSISDCCKEPIGCISHPIYSRSYRAYATHLFTLCVVSRCQHAGQVCYDAVHLGISLSGFRPSLYTICYSNNFHPQLYGAKSSYGKATEQEDETAYSMLNNYRAKIQQ